MCSIQSDSLDRMSVRRRDIDKVVRDELDKSGKSSDNDDVKHYFVHGIRNRVNQSTAWTRSGYEELLTT